MFKYFVTMAVLTTFHGLAITSGGSLPDSTRTAPRS